MARPINSKIDKNSIYELYRACRLCGAGAGYKMPIIQNVIDVDGDEVELKQKIRECVQIEVHQDDKMPPLICELCVDKVNDFYVFLDLCRRTNKRTRQLLGLPLQSTHRGNSDSGDCILGVTEPVYVNDDSNEPLSKSSPRNAKQKGSKSNKPSAKVEKPDNRDTRASNRGVKPTSNSGQKRPAPPDLGPRSTRHRRNTSEDNVTLSNLRNHSKRSPISLPPPPKSILKREPKREERSTLRSKRPQDVPKTTVPVKRVKLSVKPEKPKPPPPPPGVKCTICRQQSKTPQAHSNHLKSHTVTFTNNRLACNACREWFADSDAATAHHKRHEARSKAYICRGCRSGHSTYKLYLAHTEAGDCVPWEEVPDVQCAECWKYFPTNNLLTQHKCPGQDGRPGGKCSKCSRSYALLKNLKKHESTCTAKKKGEVQIDPELMAKVRPIQVRMVRCDPLLERVKNGHYDIGDVPENYGLDPNRVYPYINSASLNFNRMVNIKTELHDFYCEEDYIHWDSDNSTDNETDDKCKEVASLTKLTLKTLFSQKCLGRVPRKKKKVKTEKSLFDSIMGNDFDMSKDIDSIISNLGDDDNVESRTDNDDSKISDANESVRSDGENKEDREASVTDESANLDDSNKDESKSNDKIDSVSNEHENNVEDESKHNDGSDNAIQVQNIKDDKVKLDDSTEDRVQNNNSSEEKVQLNENNDGKTEMNAENDESEDREQINHSSHDKERDSDGNVPESDVDGKNLNEESVEQLCDEAESSKEIVIDKTDHQETSIEKQNHEIDSSTNNTTISESIVDNKNNDDSVSKNEENGEKHAENLDVNKKEPAKINTEIRDDENITDNQNDVNVIDSTDIDKDSLRINDVSASNEDMNVSENDKNPEGKSSYEKDTDISDETNTDIVNKRDITENNADNTKENTENSIEKTDEAYDSNHQDNDTNNVQSMETDKDYDIQSETGDSKDNTEQNDSKDEKEDTTNDTQQMNEDKLKLNGDIDERREKKSDDLTDSEIDDQKLMDALNEHIGETEENDANDVTNIDGQSDDDAKVDEAKSEIKTKDVQYKDDSNNENKITLEDLVPSKVEATPSMDLDSISDDEFNFDS